LRLLKGLQMFLFSTPNWKGKIFDGQKERENV